MNRAQQRPARPASTTAFRLAVAALLLASIVWFGRDTFEFAYRVVASTVRRVQ